MKQSKTVFYFKLVLIIILLSAFLYCVYRQITQEEDSNKISYKEYSHAQTVTQVIPGGIMTGIYAETRGVLCLGLGTLDTEHGEIPSPAEGIIKKGDYILSCNGKQLESKEELIEAVKNCEGQLMYFVILRGDKELEVNVMPRFSDGAYRLGIWVRDDIAGLGMITYVTADLQYGALGHGIVDADLGIHMQIREGSLHTAKLTEIKKGQEGDPGQLVGYISYRASKPKGTIELNSTAGIRGEFFELPDELKDVSYVALGDENDVKKGTAYLICDVSGKRETYKIEIEKVYGLLSSGNKNFLIRITDERLLELTGGIVQGMSGSPIIQDGKLIGAVTHVLVGDPTRGYGIFIENMID